MNQSPLIQQLVDSLCCLPGVGPKSAQRMALHLLERKPEAGMALSAAIAEAIDKVGRCSRCRTLTESPLCQICASSRRDERLLCVVENPLDIYAIEQSGEYQGFYFVLFGHLSPIDGIGPEDIGIDQLVSLVEREQVEEVILATGTTAEGEATAYYIGEQLRGSSVALSRIAHGVPMGGELEYVDGGTLARALAGRLQL